MTGEITLRGRVLPIGGLKEKLLAALRGGVKTVLIPKDNEKDLADIPDNVKTGMEIIPVATVDEVLAKALARPLTRQWSGPTRMSSPKTAAPMAASDRKVRARTKRAQFRSIFALQQACESRRIAPSVPVTSRVGAAPPDSSESSRD